MLSSTTKGSDMRVEKPRIEPLQAEQWSPAAAQLMQPFVDQGRVFNIFKTMSNHPDLTKRWMVFANHILGKSTLVITAQPSEPVAFSQIDLYKPSDVPALLNLAAIAR